MNTQIRPSTSRAIFLLIALLFGWSTLAGPGVRIVEKVDPEKSDIHLYEAILDRINDGENYYHAAIQEQHERGYPISPAPTVRLPTSALLISALGPKISHALILSLALVVTVVATVQIGNVALSRLQRIGAAFLLLPSLVILGPMSIYLHETWSVLLIFLSVLIARRSFTLSLLLACLAFAFRELVAPYFFAMAIYEYFRGQRKSAIIWAATGFSCIFSYSLHILALNNALEGMEPITSSESASWFAFGGWPFIVGSVRSVTALTALPLWISSFVVPFALLGWLLQKSDLARRVSYAVLGFVIPFLIIGRPNNNYWAMLYAFYLLPGLAFSWQATRTLLISALNLQSQANEKPTVQVEPED